MWVLIFSSTAEIYIHREVRLSNDLEFNDDVKDLILDLLFCSM